MSNPQAAAWEGRQCGWLINDLISLSSHYLHIHDSSAGKTEYRYTQQKEVKSLVPKSFLLIIHWKGNSVHMPRQRNMEVMANKHFLSTIDLLIQRTKPLLIQLKQKGNRLKAVSSDYAFCFTAGETQSEQKTWAFPVLWIQWSVWCAPLAIMACYFIVSLLKSWPKICPNWTRVSFVFVCCVSNKKAKPGNNVTVLPAFSPFRILLH